LKWLAVALLLLVSTSIGFVLYVPIAVLSDKPAAMASGSGAQLSPGTSIARGLAVFDDYLGADRPLNVAWRLSGLSAKPPGIGVKISVTGAARGQTDLVLSPLDATGRIRDGHLTAAIASLVDMSVFQLKGQVSINVTSATLNLRDRRLQALKGELLWEGAEIRLDEQIKFGNIHGRLSLADENQIEITLSALDSVVFLSGKIIVDAFNESAVLDLTVRPKPDAPGSLIAILEGWGTSNNGEYTIRRSLTLR
jgi:hypothetical protein